MADRVPVSGLWQTDPTLQSLIAKYIQATSGAAGSARGQAFRGSGNYNAQQIGDQISRYVNQNRQRLGIPDNYFPDIQTRGQTLYDPNQNQFRDAAITGGAMAAGGAGLAALGSAGAGAGAAAATTAAAPAVIAPAAAGGAAAGGGAAATAAGATAASGFGRGLLSRIFSNPNVDAALINAGTGLYGTKMQADAASRAAEIQAQSAREALAFLRKQYGQAQTNYKPYLDAGTAAVGRMSDQAAHLPSPMSLLGRPQSPAPTASGGMVQMQAPRNDPVTGRPIMKMVRPDQVDHFKALGARMA